MTLTVGELFAGIGGIGLGLERAGMRTRWQVEIDSRCRAVLAKNFPIADQFADVREVGSHNLIPVDLIAGGFPCQDISQAGRGAGIRGARSGLWSEFARIVRELRPKYVLVENVPLLRKRGLGAVLGDLAALGYDAEWDCIPALAVGAAHRRDRIFILAYANGRGHVHGETQEQPTDAGASAFGELVAGGTDGMADPDPQRLQGSWLPEGQRGQTIPDISWGSAHSERSPLRQEFVWAPEPNVARVADGLPDQLDRIRELGNAVVPQVVEWIGRRIVEADAAMTSTVLE